MHRQHQRVTCKTGFSLVELSIVLVILGLLTGGILTGQNLIRAAELRTITTQFQGYQTAVLTFRDKYFALPGDMSNASDFWGAATAGGSCDTTATGTGTATCNGNSDGQIISLRSNTNGGLRYDEQFTFWQHLANAGLIEGTYSGKTSVAGNSWAATSSSLPVGKISNSLWGARYLENAVSATRRVDGEYSNHFVFGTSASAADWVESGALTPEEAWNVDKKIDDGAPFSGRIVAGLAHVPSGTDGYNNAGGTLEACTLAVNSTDYDKNYDLDVTTKACFLHMFWERSFTR